MARTITLSANPVFTSVTGLTNTTFNPDRYREDRMATEAQLVQVERAIGDLQARKEYCCREIVIWRSYVRVVAEDTGIVLSDWMDNMQVGSARRGTPFTVDFSLPHDSARFFDNRSSRNLVQGDYYNAFAVRVNAPGYATGMESKFFETAIGNATSRSNAANNFFFDDSTEYWPNSESFLGCPRLLTSSRQLPALSNTTVAGIDNYYVYKDETDNKIKIDVRRLDQYANGEYLALFFTQFVQRKEYA